MSELIKHVTDATYQNDVVDSSIPVLLDFWAPWCGPCLALNPALEALAATYEGELKIVKINSDENKELVSQFSVRGIPQLFLVKDGGKSVTAVRERTRTRLSMELDGLLS